MHPWHHAISSAKKWGGKPEDYLPIHNWFDESKAILADFRHRALRHHTEGIFVAEQVFGVVLTNSDGKRIPVRFVGEQHVKEDLGFIPSAADWLKAVQPRTWMMRKGKEVDADLAATTRHDDFGALKVCRILSPGELDTEGIVTMADILEQAGRMPDRACATDIAGTVPVEAEDGKVYAGSVESLLDEADPEYVMDTSAEAESDVATHCCPARTP